MNHFFGFSIIVQNNHMIQVASCEQAIVKRKRKPIHQSKTILPLKRTHWNLSLTDISSTWLAITECRAGFPCFLMVNSALSRFLCKNDCLAKHDFSYFSNYKHKNIMFEQNMIISSHLLIRNHLHFDAGFFIKLRT